MDLPVGAEHTELVERGLRLLFEVGGRGGLRHIDQARQTGDGRCRNAPADGERCAIRRHLPCHGRDRRLREQSRQRVQRRRRYPAVLALRVRKGLHHWPEALFQDGLCERFSCLFCEWHAGLVETTTSSDQPY